jgi:hypothetical protein
MQVEVDGSERMMGRTKYCLGMHSHEFTHPRIEYAMSVIKVHPVHHSEERVPSAPGRRPSRDEAAFLPPTVPQRGW